MTSPSVHHDMQDLTRSYWTHADDCGVSYEHIHYGKNVVLKPVPGQIPWSVLEAYNELKYGTLWPDKAY